MTSFRNNSEETEKVTQSPLSTTCKAFTSCVQQPFPRLQKVWVGTMGSKRSHGWREPGWLKNYISLAKNETGANVVNLTSNCLPKWTLEFKVTFFCQQTDRISVCKLQGLYTLNFGFLRDALLSSQYFLFAVEQAGSALWCFAAFLMKHGNRGRCLKMWNKDHLFQNQLSNLVKMQIPGPHPRPSEFDFLGLLHF